MSSTKAINARFTEDEYERLRDHAQSSGKSLQQVIHDAVMQDVDGILETVRRSARESEEQYGEAFREHFGEDRPAHPYHMGQEAA